MNNDIISRKALIKWIDDSVSQYGHIYSTDMLNMWGLFKDYLINNAPTVNPFLPISEEVFYKITDAEWEHSDSFWITTPSGKKIEFEKKRPQAEWITVDDVYCECPFCKNKEVKFSKYCPECGAILKSIEKST